jgi:hypothetical protein
MHNFRRCRLIDAIRDDAADTHRTPTTGNRMGEADGHPAPAPSSEVRGSLGPSQAGRLWDVTGFRPPETRPGVVLPRRVLAMDPPGPQSADSNTVPSGLIDATSGRQSPSFSTRRGSNLAWPSQAKTLTPVPTAKKLVMHSSP